MYIYDDFDRTLLAERVNEFRDQVGRRLSGALTEDEFKPLRLMNGVYLQLHAYMLRIAIPYGTLSSPQLRTLAHIARRYDRGYGHFTTRQNMQFNWIKLSDLPDVMADLAETGLHGMQTSGNCVRNITTDQWAGVAPDELEDPRIYAEILRQHCTMHPEFSFLPRKFKIAITGSPNDRAVTRSHDIGLRMIERGGEAGFEVLVGGGLGRTPLIGQVLRDFLPRADLLPYVESILAAYNAAGRRDNKYKARLKITVLEGGLDEFRAAVEAEFPARRAAFTGVDQALLADITDFFAPPAFRDADEGLLDAARAVDPVFRAWTDTNLHPHRRADHAIVTLSLKAHGATPGDATAEQMRAMADLADAYGYGELRISHEQNVILPHVHKGDLPAVHAALKAAELATANIGLISDIIACPGMDYCALATARSIPIAEEIADHFRSVGLEEEIGNLNIRISGCINACGHHHLGHIGILGLDRAGVENYQITLGGDAYDIPAIGERAGAGFPAEQVVPAIDRLLRAYLEVREDASERFIDAYRRLGQAPFKAALYPVAADA